jgi:hypothetical protein
MDVAVLTAVGLVGAYVGYLIGLVVRGAFVERGDGGGGGEPGEPWPEGPSGTQNDFGLWELELAGSSVNQA